MENLTRTITCSICKETDHNMRTCPFGYVDHFKRTNYSLADPSHMEDLLVSELTQAMPAKCLFEPCYRFDPVFLLTEPLVAEVLPIDTVKCILLSDVSSRHLLSANASEKSELPVKKKFRFSDKLAIWSRPELKPWEFNAPMSENMSPDKMAVVFGEDKDDEEDIKLNALSAMNKVINTLCPKVNGLRSRGSESIMSKAMVAKEQQKNYMRRNNPIEFVMGEILTSTKVMEDLVNFPKKVLEKVCALIQDIIVEFNEEGREVYPLYESHAKIKKNNIKLLKDRIGIIEIYLNL
jgi:hypothetical protein